MKSVSARFNKSTYRYFISYFITGLITLIYVFIMETFYFPESPRINFMPLTATIINNTIVLVSMELVLLQQRKAQVEIENADLKFKNLLAEQERLKHQLQPHFLFNALSTLKILIGKRPEEAEKYLMRLSDFLRASITSLGNNTILLERELGLSIDYLEMQKVRFKNALKYTVDIDLNLLQIKHVPFFSIQLLIENAIKHNVFTEEYPLKLSIYSSDEYIVVRNNINLKKESTHSTGLGLKILTDRYRHLIDKELKIIKIDNEFIVTIPLISNENNNH